MNNESVLIISNKMDIHTDSVVYQLNEMGVGVIRLNSEDFKSNNIVVDIMKENLEISTLEGRLIEPNKISSVYVRRISPLIVDDVHADYKEFVTKETNVIFESLAFLLQKSRWMDIPCRRDWASNKIHQLHLAKQYGFSIPDTLVTNDLETFYDFLKKHKKLIYKTLYRPIIYFNEKGTGVINTTLLNNDYISKLKETLPVTPCLFQPYVEKKCELRIHVIGEEIVAIKIDSQSNTEALIDWRCAEFNDLNYSLHNLDSDTTKKILKLMGLLGLNFGIIDMVITPDNNIVFLEINPNGNWLWIEKKIGINISQRIAVWLSRQ